MSEFRAPVTAGFVILGGVMVLGMTGDPMALMFYGRGVLVGLLAVLAVEASHLAARGGRDWRPVPLVLCLAALAYAVASIAWVASRARYNAAGVVVGLGFVALLGLALSLGPWLALSRSRRRVE
jgi:hypothetical protein